MLHCLNSTQFALFKRATLSKSFTYCHSYISTRQFATVQIILSFVSDDCCPTVEGLHAKKW